ncbi:MAG: lytic murein transglycosylase [Ideonella sp.]
MSFSTPIRRCCNLLAALLVCIPVSGHAQMALSQCIETLQRELPRYPNVRPETFTTYTQEAQDLRPRIDKASSTQPEFELQIWDYLARLVDAERISDGQAVLAEQSSALARIAARYGVDPATVVAVLGVESDFGRLQGRHKVIDATLSRACLRLSNQERKAHFFAALWLAQQGFVKPDDFRGSWAGAFGMTQFMPGTHLQFMADGDGDGIIDTLGNMPDALATTANYLKGLGWTDGLPWAIEVSAPPGVTRQHDSSEREHNCLGKAQPSGKCRTLAQWAALGVRRVDGKSPADRQARWPSLESSTSAALLAPAGPDGPAWLLTKNFHAIWQYNRADSYALAIGQLSAALRGDPTQQTPWSNPDAALALSRAGFSQLQTMLRAAGQCAVAVDGYDGPSTREAIRAEEQRRGWSETGQPTILLLDKLRAEPFDSSGRCRTESAAQAVGANGAQQPAR